MRGVLSFAEVGRSPAQLMGDGLEGWRGNDRPTGPASPDTQPVSTIFTQSGRAAIALAARAWAIGAGDEVLVPSYNCGCEISPLVASGAKVSMYRVDAHARIDVGDLVGRITARTRVIHITHYFGRSAETGPLAALCRERGIKLLEDCALSMFSAGTGQLGDAVIFSLRKTLPVFDGGILVLRDGSSPPGGLPAASRREQAKGLLRQSEHWLRAAIRYQPALSGATRRGSDERAGSLPDLPASYYAVPSAVVRQGSRFALGLLRRTDPTQVVQARRANYAVLRDHLRKKTNVALPWDDEETLPLGQCPLGLPILVDDKPAWCKALRARGIGVTPWWTGCHRGMDWDRFPEALALKARLILLPVHQALDFSDMERVSAAVEGVAHLRNSTPARSRGTRHARLPA